MLQGVVDVLRTHVVVHPRLPELHLLPLLSCNYRYLSLLADFSICSLAASILRLYRLICLILIIVLHLIVLGMLRIHCANARSRVRSVDVLGVGCRC